MQSGVLYYYTVSAHTASGETAKTIPLLILDDTANEFDPNAPTFGERHAPPWIPVS